MLGSLMTDGLEITSEPSEADALIVNTCSFIDTAQEESVDTILESAEYREAQRPGQALIVSGCLSQRFRKELPRLMPEVDAFMGVDQIADVSRIVREAIAHRANQPINGVPKRARKRTLLPLTEIHMRPHYVLDVENEDRGMPGLAGFAYGGRHLRQLLPDAEQFQPAKDAWRIR